MLCSLDLLSGCSDQLRVFSLVLHPHPLPSLSLSASLPLLTPPPLSPHPPLLLLSCLHLLSSSPSSSPLLNPSTASLTLTSLSLPVIHPFPHFLPLLHTLTFSLISTFFSQPPLSPLLYPSYLLLCLSVCLCLIPPVLLLEILARSHLSCILNFPGLLYPQAWSVFFSLLLLLFPIMGIGVDISPSLGPLKFPVLFVSTPLFSRKGVAIQTERSRCGSQSL